MPTHQRSQAYNGLAYRPGIDGMRAIAVLGVVLYHAGFGPPGGFVGVDVFFVISGFLITTLLEAELASSGRVDLAAFYARRVRRLMPALGVVLVVTSVACLLFLSPYGELSAALRSASAALLFGANIFFQYTTGDYFGPNVDHLPFLHLWSLGVEEQYYLLWPIALTLAQRIPLGTRKIAFALCILGSLAFAEWAIYQGSQAAFYAMPSRWWELSLGALIAWSPQPAPRTARWEATVGLGLIVAAMAAPTVHFPGLGALPATVGAALLLHGSSADGGPWRLLASSPLLVIGQVSYPLYLWHWPLLALAAVLIPGEIPAATRAALALAAFLLAAGTWRWVEQPVRRQRVVSPGKLAFATLAACGAAAFLTLQVADMTKASPPADDPGAIAANDAPPNRLLCHNSSLRPPAMPDEKACILGHGTAPRVAIWGDSHAFAFQPFATVIAARQDTTAIAFSRDGCAPAIGYDNGQHAQPAAWCKAFNDDVLHRVEAMDIVILSSRWPNPADRNFAEDLSATVEQLAGHVRRVLIIGPTPDLPASVPECLRQHIPQACDLSRPDFLSHSKTRRELLTSIASRFQNVTYIEPVDFFCGASTCPGARDGMALYWDDNHISSTAATAFGRYYVVSHASN
ncbi:acyltransferase family protein [Luteibacter sp.]|uniref:acyltransferase family protein n=1 Tax=Luteibacter sp. TaxID=1886636 RepID=UPI003F7CDF59